MTSPVPLRDASTIMIVRDAPQGSGIEVLMLRRNARSQWASGIHLFPGGAVDEEDGSPGTAAVCSGRSDEEASRVIGVERGGSRFFVAAIRECYEEAGILLARRADGEPVSLGEPEAAARFERWRRLLNRGETHLASICRSESLTLALDGLCYFSHWVTPVGSPRRYDTRFFVALLPEDQTALHDDDEVVDSIWMRPEEALARQRDGSIDMWLPTMSNVEAISRFERAADVMEAAAAAEVATVMPRITVDDSGMRILLPGDDGYEEATGLPPDTPFPEFLHRAKPGGGGNGGTGAARR